MRYVKTFHPSPCSLLIQTKTNHKISKLSRTFHKNHVQIRRHIGKDLIYDITQSISEFSNQSLAGNSRS